MCRLLRFCLLLVFVPLTAVGAGFSDGLSKPGGEARYTPEQIIRFSKQVERLLAERGARVAIVSRMGRLQSELPQGMHFTHAGFAVYSEIRTSDGRTLPGYAMYNLYQSNEHPDASALAQDFPVDFFAGVAELEAGVVIPSAELQRRLLGVIASPTYAALHDPRYSAIANPYTLGKQNCTEFLLDVINAAIYRTDSIKRIKAGEKAYFVAQKVHVNPLKLMLGAMFSAEIAMSDQPGDPVTATFETIASYLKQYDEGAEVLTVYSDKPDSPASGPQVN